MLSSAYRALTLLFASLLVLACVMISSSAEVESDRPFRAANAEDTSLKSSAMMHEIVLPAGRLVLAWVIMSVVVGIVFVRTKPVWRPHLNGEYALAAGVVAAGRGEA
ncbi:hypothetical protein FOZ63_002363 [Perkinsus olseni]|uniref:Uncharacterized protein n=1 Tax=Perkinsus olseni TaxID=32597 RepID=A0A7J6NE33_PEROL|nr:hypothetical protein FOZ63_002363 [Perkinsus olseni]KAF4682106.1 hypothetical protein FOZ60_011058 [Perkinsus olseni]